MVGIRLRKLRIENYRGILKMDVNISDTTVLIGENNTGKTSVMNAIQKCLREFNSRRGPVFEPFDFYLDEENSEPTKPIKLELTFSEDSPDQWDQKVVRNLNKLKVLQVDEANLSKVILRISCEFDAASREIKQDWAFLNIEGDVLIDVTESAYWSFQRQVSLFYLPALRSAERHFDPKGPYWSPFLKDGRLTEEQRDEIENKLKEANDMVVNSHESFKEVSSLLESVNTLLPLSTSNTASIAAVPNKISDILRKAQVNLSAVTGAKIPVARHGDGTQSLAVLMLFSAFLKTYSDSEAIIALEEPEAHLHPSAVRTMWKAIEDIPGQRLISTHSGDLISQVDINSLRRLSNVSSGVTCYSTENVLFSEDEIRKFRFHVQMTRGELLFANSWLMVEGETETWVYSAAARACGFDLNKVGVRIVEIGISDVGMLAKLANALGIPWYCVIDDDNGKKKYEPKVLSNLGNATQNERLAVPYKNIEVHLLESGFKNIYSRHMPRQNLEKIKLNENDPRYLEEYAKYFPRRHKTSAAAEVGMEIDSQGCSSVSRTMKDVLEHVVDLARKK